MEAGRGTVVAVVVAASLAGCLAVPPPAGGDGGDGAGGADGADGCETLLDEEFGELDDRWWTNLDNGAGATVINGELVLAVPSADAYVSVGSEDVYALDGLRVTVIEGASTSATTSKLGIYDEGGRGVGFFRIGGAHEAVTMSGASVETSLPGDAVPAHRLTLTGREILVDQGGVDGVFHPQGVLTAQTLVGPVTFMFEALASADDMFAEVRFERLLVERCPP